MIETIAQRPLAKFDAFDVIIRPEPERRLFPNVTGICAKPNADCLRAR
jgi:hypothetical protein